MMGNRCSKPVNRTKRRISIDCGEFEANSINHLEDSEFYEQRGMVKALLKIAKDEGYKEEALRLKKLLEQWS